MRARQKEPVSRFNSLSPIDDRLVFRCEGDGVVNRGAQYHNFASLEEDHVKPNEHFLMVPANAENERAGKVKKKFFEQQQAAESHSVGGNNGFVGQAEGGAVAGGDGRDSFVPPTPPLTSLFRKPASQDAPAISGLGEVVQQPVRNYMSRYEGLGFSFREDALALREDTNLLAVVCILCSCENIMADAANLVSSVALHTIDKMSVAINELRRENYERYHYPPIPPQKRGPINTQDIPYQDWAF